MIKRSTVKAGCIQKMTDVNIINDGCIQGQAGIFFNFVRCVV